MSVVAFEWTRSPVAGRWAVWITVDGERAAITAMDEPEASKVFRALETGEYDNRGAVPDVLV